MIAAYRKPSRTRTLAAGVLLCSLAAVGLTDARGEPKVPQSSSDNSAATPAPADPKGTADPSKGTLSGTVVNPDGKPVAGARVLLSTAEFDGKTLKSSAKTLAEATTDPDGRFRLGPIEPVYRARFDLRIEADGFAPQYIPSETYSIYAGSDSDLGKICVYRGRVFSGQVVDVDGKPRAGATVECEVHRFYMGHTIMDVSPARTVTTDANGRFRTPPLSVGHAGLIVQEPERQLVYRALPAQPGGEEVLTEPIRLANDVPVAGVIKDEEGRPIEGAAIRANAEYRATSDAQGNFVIRGFGPNPHFQLQIAKEGHVFINWGVQVSDEGFTWHEVQSTDRKPFGPVKDFTVVMKRQAWIEGQALDAETGEPVRLDKVVLCTFERKPNGEILRAGCKDSNFEQPETGRFRVPYSFPGEYTLTFSAAGYHDAETFTPLVKELQPIDGIVVKLKKDKDGAKPEIQTQRFAGVVTRDGKPLKNGWAGLWALRRPSDVVNAYVMRGRTATGWPAFWGSAPIIQDGAYSLDVPFQDAGWYVVVEEPGQAITQVGPFRIKANEEKKLDIACTEGGGISGRVENVPDTWKGQLWVVAFSPTAVRAETRVDAGGKFSFKQLPPGKYGLKVGHDAYEDSEVPRAKDWKDIPKDAWTRIADPWKRATMAKVEAGQETTDVQLELPQ